MIKYYRIYFIFDSNLILLFLEKQTSIPNFKINQTWKQFPTTVAGGHGYGNGQGDRNDQLNYPTNVIIDQQNDSLFICDWMNRRVVRWPRRNGRTGEILISNIACWDLMMDKDGYLYVSDMEKREIRRWKIGEENGTIVAGGNGQGNGTNQLNHPHYIFIDEDHSVYVSDWKNHR